MRDRTFEPIDGYCLRLRTTAKGNLMVDREQWIWWGDDVGTTGGGPVGGPFRTKEAASRFAKSYTAEHAGCMTTDAARRAFESTAALPSELS